MATTSPNGIYYHTSANAPITEEARSLAVANSVQIALNKTTGLIPIIPTSVTVYNGPTGTASVGTTGIVTFTGVNSFALNGVFLSSYDYVNIKFNTWNGPGNYLWAKFTTAGTYTTTAAYYTTAAYKQGASMGNWADGAGQSYVSLGYIPSSEMAGTDLTVWNPMYSLNYGYPVMNWTSFYHGGNGTWVQGTAKWNGGANFDGINFLSSAGNIFSGTVQAWGFRK